MRNVAIALSVLVLLAAGCRQNENKKTYEPALRLELAEVSSGTASIGVTSIDAEKIAHGCSSSGEPSLTDTMATGSTGSVVNSILLDPLVPGTEYSFCAQGIGPGGEKGNTVSLNFNTLKLAGSLYPWEKSRGRVPSFADMSLITLGRHNANPPAWTADRFASHVSYTDEGGKAHWLFDSFLCIDSFDPVRGLSYTLTNGSPSSVKDSWQDLLDLWLGDDGAVKKLDEAVLQASAALGEPARPRYVIMSLPDPVMFRNFADKGSSTVYWGKLNGRDLDFSKPEDQEAAYQWYMDECRKRFSQLDLRHVELCGFYILSEELHLSPDFYSSFGLNGVESETFNWRYKHWEVIVPWAAAYAHSCNEGLWWIPYHMAPGYKLWKELGFDMAFMQPNYYWDNGDVSHPLSKTAEALKRYRMGIELEFEYSLVAEVMADGRSGPDGSGKMVFTKADVPMLRGRVREYMQAYKDTGLYGVLPIAVYSGTDAWHQLAVSQDSGDSEMFLEICRFITQSAMKR
jgi:hypothetical protein